MSVWESFRIAFEGVWTNKMRSALTMLGIVIGIASVIAVVAIGQGGRIMLEKEVSRVLGVNVFRIYINWSEGEVRGLKDFTLEDVDIIRGLVPELRTLSANSDTYLSMRGPRDSETVSLSGSSEGFLDMQDLTVKKGRLFSAADVKAGRPVAVLEDKLAEKLFGHVEPLGKKVTVNKSQLVVIGIVENKESFLNGNRSTAYVPITTWQDIFHTKQIFFLQGQAESKETLTQAMEKSVTVLERRHRKEGHYLGSTLEQEMQQVNQVTGIMTLVVGAIAGISLVVGGIGVMNIMLVSVTERTREIGIRKALGARSRDIKVQFLIESLVLCTIGGIIGMSLGIGGTLLISLFAKLPPLVSWLTVAVAFAFSSAVGIFFGLYPAGKAANLDPIEALRFE